MFNAIWEQEQGLEWVARHGLTGDEYQALFTDLSNEGFRLRCVSPYEDHNGARFACIWDRYAGPAWTARHGLTAQEYQSEFNAQQQRGFRLVRVVGYPTGGQIRYAGIWESSPGHPGNATHGLSHDEYQRQFDAHSEPSSAGQAVLADATATNRHGQEVMYFGLNRDAPYEIRVDRMDAHGGWAMTPAEVLRFVFSVDGLPTPPDLLQPATRTAMTTASAVRPVTPTTTGYARGWAVNNVGTIWHDGTLPGTQAILVRPSDGRAWSAVCNAGRPGTSLATEFDDLMWKVQQAI
ncbi:serine hydrolase [Streptomyces sp. NPDC086080]|uniref:serine hydrolase n=1 Tax=Streptomyces sp. NPDC086080 TaxID=3365748 RepID=UPI0037CCED8B